MSTEISRREQALGYPGPNTQNAGAAPSSPIRFALPSINLPSISEMGLPRPDRLAKYPWDHRDDTTSEEKEGEKLVPVGDGSNSMTAAARSTLLAGRPSPPPPRQRQPTPLPSLPPEAVHTFSTSVPDDCLQFVNPSLLSVADKAKLENQRHRRGSDGSLAASPPPPNEAVPPRPPSAAASFQTQKKRVATEAASTKKAVNVAAPVSVGATIRRKPASSSPSQPILGPWARTSDQHLHLLRQVTNNNLQLPSSAPPPPRRPTSHEVYHSPISHETYHRPLPFTCSPLVHPPPRQQGKKVHPPPTEKPKPKPPYPSVFEPVSPSHSHSDLLTDWGEQPILVNAHKRSPPTGHQSNETRGRSAARHQR